MSTKGTAWPAATLNSAVCAMPWPVRSTGVRSHTESGPAVALIPPSVLVTHGTMDP